MAFAGHWDADGAQGCAGYCADDEGWGRAGLDVGEEGDGDGDEGGGHGLHLENVQVRVFELG